MRFSPWRIPWRTPQEMFASPHILGMFASAYFAAMLDERCDESSRMVYAVLLGAFLMLLAMRAHIAWLEARRRRSAPSPLPRPPEPTTITRSWTTKLKERTNVEH